MWLLVELVGRFAAWLVGRLGRDMENEEWEHGSRSLPGLGHDADLPDEPPDAHEPT